MPRSGKYSDAEEKKLYRWHYSQKRKLAKNPNDLITKKIFDDLTELRHTHSHKHEYDRFNIM